MISTRKSKANKGTKIESHKNDGVNRLLCITEISWFLIWSHLNGKKRRSLISKSLFHWNQKEILSREDFRSCSIHVCLNKGKICIMHLLKNTFVNMSTNKFTFLNEDEILAEEVKTFHCLYYNGSRSYQGRGVVRHAWVEVVKKVEFLEDGKCC